MIAWAAIRTSFDIHPAKRMGFSTVFIGLENQNSEADLAVSFIAELTTHPATQRPKPKTV